MNPPAIRAPARLPARPAARERRLRLALGLGRLIRRGTLALELPDGSRHLLGGAEPGPQARVILRAPHALGRMLAGGSLGLAEAYLDGSWESPDLRAVMALAAANEEEWAALLRGRRWMRALALLAHRLRRNSRPGARRNIRAHYDLGNDFYALWLDPSMTYSSAIFDTPDEPLEAAQARKFRRLCRAIGLAPGMRLLEIGCGWGRLAEIAAGEFGATVEAITLSPAQAEAARTRIARAGLAERVRIREVDYREVAGDFDRIVSVEMFEAVGEEYWPAFFATLRARLRPGGLAGLQVITIADRFFADYRRTADFIQRHVFPGGMLPSPRRLAEEAARAGLAWRDADWFGAHYAETLARWQHSFQAAWPRIASLGRYDARFKRLWEYYLAYCETGFRAGWTDVGQIVLARPA